jgi:succinate dehydrogenase / fumarate reductase cytochrome b subunit
MVYDQRPVNLNLLTIRQPITAVVSILHRITGLVLLLSLPLMFWALHLALTSQEGFNTVMSYLLLPQGQLLVLGIWTAFAFHLCAGIRHIIMDFGWSESLAQARFGAYFVMILTLILVVLGGIWLC